MIQKILQIIENLLKPVPTDKKAEDSWNESDIYDDTDEDPFDSKGHMNRLNKLHQDARKSIKLNPNHPN